MARWSTRPRHRPRKPLSEAVPPFVTHWNVHEVIGFDGFLCGCEVSDDVYLVCLSCGHCEDCCLCLTADSACVWEDAMP